MVTKMRVEAVKPEIDGDPMAGFMLIGSVTPSGDTLLLFSNIKG
jgi:hypothetical protein